MAATSSYRRHQPSSSLHSSGSDPSTWSENNPFRDFALSSSTNSTISRASSVRDPRSSKSSRPSARRHHSDHRVHRQKPSLRPGADTIDRLGNVDPLGFGYHHDGPYDATLIARNRIPRYAPVEALKESNAETLRATPAANVRDCLEKHYPLQMTAVFPPGMGGVGEYTEVDVNRLGENGYKRWAHIQYLDEDLKGKGEPSYTIEEFEKQQKAAKKAERARTRMTIKGETEGYEMVESGGKSGVTARERSESAPMSIEPGLGALGRSTSLSGRLKKRFSVRRKKDE